MSNGLRSFLAFILTFVITRTGELYFKFNPTIDLPLWRGVVLDFGIWILVFSFSYWVIGKFANKQATQQ